MKNKPEAPEILVAGRNSFAGAGQCDCDCDCACAESGTPLDLIPIRETSRWQKVPELVRLAVSPTHHAIFNPQAPLGIAYCNESACRILDTLQDDDSLSDVTSRFPQFPDAEIKKSIELLAALNLVSSPERGLTPVTTEPASLLTAWLHLTDRCNLRCSYCYLAHLREDMSIETGKAAIDATLRSAEKYGYKSIKLKYSGGEALLRPQQLLELHAYAGIAAERKAIALDGVVLTNGTLLTPSLAAQIKTSGLRMMISLDGLDSFHNFHRHYASGQNSFHDVLRGIQIVMQAGIKPDISITVSAQSAGGLAELLDLILDMDLSFSINFYRENDFSVIQPTLTMDDNKIIAGMKAAFDVIEKKLPRRSLLASLLDRANLSVAHVKTCSVGANYLVFDPQGQVAQCQMQMRHAVGNFQAEDALALVRRQDAGIRNLPVSEKQGCADCQWRYWCAGGCPLMAHRATGRYDQQSPYCHIYQALLPSVIRLEGLRLMKYGDGALSSTDTQKKY
ncbi:MAG: SPASM domain-containing protein [Anaerolineales bacterium]|jgi:uncharacterized protein|nr:SPASM domain-containing protein [Anaerolineales bacterium]